jgi:radical SAM protein with 4Fe4S-binding SPASM domain
MHTLRHFAYRANYLASPLLNHKVPIDVSLELSSTCDMACAYCYHNSKEVPFSKGLMDKQLAFKILAQCAELGVNSVKFNYRGEATINPAYSEIAELAKDLARGSTFIDRLTNSNFKFHPRRRDDIFKGLAHLTKVKVSYDSFRKDVFETQRNGGNHDLTTENIDLFYNSPERIKSETKLVIQAVRTNLNKDEDIAGIAKARWPDAEISIRDMVAGRIEKDLTRLESRVRDPERKTCIQAHARLIVHFDGRVAPCCPSIKNDLLIGDLTKQTVSEVFNSDAAKALRKSLKDKTAFFKEPCKSCPSFESYKGYKPNWNS